MRVHMSPAAAAFISGHGGQLWVWAARPRMCCSATAWMRAATTAPDGVAGFEIIAVPGTEPPGSAQAGSGLPGTGQPVLRVHVRRAAGQLPDVLEIDITGRHSPRVAAYWDGCLMAMV
jgi:hypothetical protein